ncbi:MAG: FxLYD domain-containing protein, partial [Alphaproteobacteria bacterium]|nr:FxLYD domain-containing protein [Alphaproteobacteria bacterium]
NVKWEHKRRKGQPVLVVLGEVVNTSDKPRSVPRLRVVIRDESERRLFRWTVTTALNSLEPGQVTKFSTRLANPPEGARSLAVAFQIRP